MAVKTFFVYQLKNKYNVLYNISNISLLGEDFKKCDHNFDSC